MKKLKQKIEDIIAEKHTPSVFFLPALLFVLSMVYQFVVQMRSQFFKYGVFRRKKLPCKVVSIGNICVGGTGKTPMTIYTAKLLKEMGYDVCVISRGYKGEAEETGGIVSDGKTLLMDAIGAGDEPYMMAKNMPDIPVMVGKNRYKMGKIAINRLGAQVIVLDDAFQHRKLYRDMDVVLLDYSKPFGNFRLLPRGRLREPINEISRSHVIVFTRSEKKAFVEKKDLLSNAGVDVNKKPILFSYHIPYLYKIIRSDKQSSAVRENKENQGLLILKQKKVFAFSGIADNQNFERTVDHYCGKVSGFWGFSDHHQYTDRELKTIISGAKETSAELIVTTEKDYAKISQDFSWPIDLAVIGIKISFEDDEAVFKKKLMEMFRGN